MEDKTTAGAAKRIVVSKDILRVSKNTHHGVYLARITHESVWRDREDGLAAGKPQELESEAY